MYCQQKLQCQGMSFISRTSFILQKMEAAVPDSLPKVLNTEMNAGTCHIMLIPGVKGLVQ